MWPLFLSAAAYASAAAAEPVLYEDLTALDARIAAISPAQPIDKRLKLPRCPDAPEISVAQSQGIAIRCTALGWRLFAARLSPAPDLAITAPSMHRGDPVDIVVTGAGFMLSTAATALEDAPQGRQVRLKLDDKATIIQAVVTGPGQARLDLTPQD